MRLRSRSALARAGAVAWQLIGIAVAVILAGWAAGQLMPVLVPVGVALLLTALLRPVHCALERRGLPPAPAALLTLGAVMIVFGGLVAFVVPPFVSRVGDLTSNVDGGLQRLAYSVAHDLAGMDHAAVQRALGRAEDAIRSHLGGLAGDALAGATTIAGALAAAVLVLFLTFFMLKDGTRLSGWIVGLAPERRRLGLREVARRAWAVLTTYARGVVFVATFDAVFIGIALLLVGVPLALPLIVLTWLGAFFPIVGAVTAGAAAVLVALVANGFGSALLVLAAIVVVQQIEGHVLYPLVVGPRLKLHPIAVLLAVAVGGTIAGLAGAFLAVPAATVGAVVLSYLREDDEDRNRTLPARDRLTVVRRP
jgi:predicted PurR-regulated permease PerM